MIKLKTEFLKPAKNSVLSSDLYKGFDLRRLYLTTYVKSHAGPDPFRDVKTYCMFVGHARSGGTLVGSLLDAHPNAIVADEVDALRYVQAGFSRDQVYHLLLARSQKDTNDGRRKNGLDGKVYAYLVPGGWNGRYSTLQVIGDRKAGISTQRLTRDPSLLSRLQGLMPGVDVRVIHVMRNPYDAISTMIVRGGEKYDTVFRRYFSNCETIVGLGKHLDSSHLIRIRNDELIADPQSTLARACDFLDLPADRAYLDACASIVYKSPSKSRNKVRWTPEMIDAVKRRIDEFDFLHGYTYGS